MRIPLDEERIVRQVADATGIDPELLAAIRRAENGGPGREFG